MDYHGLKIMLVGLALTVAGQFPQAAFAQTVQVDTSGWLEGTVTLGQAGGEPRWWYVTMIDQNGNGVYVNPDAGMNNLYVFRHVRPGTYDITVTCTTGKDFCGVYRPQRIFRVVINPNVRTILNVALEQGTALQEVGHPLVATEPVLILSDELTKLQRQLASLQQAVDSLKRRQH